MPFVLGIDEAGRGPLAGPVALGMALVPAGLDVRKAFPGVNDSKKLPEKQRERIFSLLEESARSGVVRHLVLFGSAEEIDANGISAVIHALIADGLARFAPDPGVVRVLLDGSLHAPARYRQQTIIGGDALEPAISLASIAAKVSRDRLMRELSETYPEYGFERHKGYGTKAHYEALRAYGPSVIHRRTFLPIAPVPEMGYSS